MKYVALLRGINVGGGRKVEMKKLKAVFEALGFDSVSTYINSGNVIFEGVGKTSEIRKKLETTFKKEFGFDIPTLVKTLREMSVIEKSIPKNWKHDTANRVYIAYLFPEIDNKKIISDLPIDPEFVDMRYVKGAIYWNVQVRNYGKSRINKIIGHKFYKYMTMRNLNTARFLALHNF